MTDVRKGRAAERAAVANVLDGAALAVDHDALADRLAAGDVFVAHVGDRVLGALVLAGSAAAAEEGTTTRRIDVVAVRRRRRGQGIGTALVTAAGERCDRLVAAFDADQRPFYEALGFDVEPVNEARYRGVLGAGVGRPP